MKRVLIGILVASTFAAPALASGSSAPAPASTSTSTSGSNATGGAGGSGGTASGGSGTGGTASNIVSGTYGASATNGGSATGGAANGGNSTVSVSVSLPSTSTSGTSGAGTSGTSGTGTSSGVGAASNAATGPGSSPNDTRTTVDYGGTYSVKTVPNIVAPSLTTTLSDTCMGSASFGLSFTGFGATGGTTMVDQACVRRLDSREFRAMGLNDVALALLCQSEANRKAVESTGRSCPGMERAAAPAAAPATPSASTEVVGQNNINIGDQYKDPLIRSRLGLDKLPDLSALQDR